MFLLLILRKAHANIFRIKGWSEPSTFLPLGSSGLDSKGNGTAPFIYTDVICIHPHLQTSMYPHIHALNHQADASVSSHVCHKGIHDQDCPYIKAE